MSRDPKILLIEDEKSFASVVADILTQAGYATESTSTGTAGLQAVRKNVPDLVLLDFGLPDMSGLEVLSRIRTFSNVPVIFVSGASSDRDKVMVLEKGADDYISKPFHQEELLARIAALLRRIGWNPPEATRLETGALTIDIARRQATVNKHSLHLTPTEFAVLLKLTRHASKVVTHEEMLDTVWGTDNRSDLAALRVNISRLRQKLQEVPDHTTFIQTIPRRGYRIVDLPVPPQPRMGPE